MIAVDSNIVIYFLAAHPEFGELSRDLLVAVEQTSLNACAPELLRYEVLSYSELSESEATKVANALDGLDIVYKPVSQEVLTTAAALRRTHGCGAMDAIHIASALQAKATHFVTNDKNILSKTISGIELVSLADARRLYS